MHTNTINSFQFTEVIVRAHKGAVNSDGVEKPLHMLPVAKKGKDVWSVQFDELPKLIVKMHLKNGIVGLGEFYRDHNWEVITNTARSLLGVSLEEIALKKLPIGFFREYDGFECAIWDAYAKSKKMRVVDLLGGRLQPKIKIGCWSSYRHTKEMGEVAKKYYREGYDCLKLKCGLEDDMIGWCAEIKKAASNMCVILDPNQRWENLGETKRFLKELEKIGNVFCLEDPIPFWMIEDYKTLRKMTSIKIVRHVSLPYIYQGQRSHHAIQFIKNEAADGFNFNGGIVGFSQLDAIASAANMYSWHGSEVDLGILEARYLHSVSASSHCICRVISLEG